MALINCPECGREASDLAEKCPNCGYPFKPKGDYGGERLGTKSTDIADIEKKNRGRLAAIIIVAVLLIGAVCAYFLLRDKEPSQEDTPQATQSVTEPVSTKKVRKDTGSFEEITAADVQDAVELITEKYNSLAVEVTDYDSYKKNTAAISEWYAYCIAEASAFYTQLAEDTYIHCCDIAKDGINEYSVWSDALSDTYDAWDDAMDDFYDAWTDLLEDAYDQFDDIISKGYDTSPYREVADAWSDMYDLYSDSWEDMYDLYSDYWEDLYDFYSDVFGEFYDGSTDIDKVYEKRFGKE